MPVTKKAGRQMKRESNRLVQVNPTVTVVVRYFRSANKERQKHGDIKISPQYALHCRAETGGNATCAQRCGWLRLIPLGEYGTSFPFLSFPLVSLYCPSTVLYCIAVKPRTSRENATDRQTERQGRQTIRPIPETPHASIKTVYGRLPAWTEKTQHIRDKLLRISPSFSFMSTAAQPTNKTNPAANSQLLPVLNFPPSTLFSHHSVSFSRLRDITIPPQKNKEEKTMRPGFPFHPTQSSTAPACVWPKQGRVPWERKTK